MAGEKTLLCITEINESGIEAALYVGDDTAVDVAALLIGYGALDIVELKDSIFHNGHAKLLGVAAVDQHDAIAHMCPLVLSVIAGVSGMSETRTLKTEQGPTSGLSL